MRLPIFPQAAILLSDRNGQCLVGISSITGMAMRLIWLPDLNSGGEVSIITMEDEGAEPPRTKALLRVSCRQGWQRGPGSQRSWFHVLSAFPRGWAL